MRPINVTNRFLTGITWLDAPACSFLLNNNIDVWSAAINTGSVLPDSFSAVLSPEELARASRFVQQKDRNLFIMSKWALRNIAGKYLAKQPSEIQFEAGKNKKPHIKNAGINLHYNTSHSGGRVLIAVSECAIGADIEFINTGFGYSEVLIDNFSAGEVKYINEEEHVNRFFKIWTRKEAITKATAQGLDCDLRLLPGLDGTHGVAAGIIASDEDWVINSFTINGQYAASVANNPLIDKISFFNLSAAASSPVF